MTYLIEGALKFTLKPPNPSSARKGSNAKLEWDYSVGNQDELAGIIYSVKEPGLSVFTDMLIKQSGAIFNSSTIPKTYKGRVRIEGKASLVIENVTPQDSTLFRCKLVGTSVPDQTSIVELIVTGT